MGLLTIIRSSAAGGAFDPSTVGWIIPSARIGIRRGWSVGQPDLSWLAHESAITGWGLPSGRLWHRATGRPDTNPCLSWLAGVSPVCGWNAPTDRMARALSVWTSDTNPGVSWISPALPIVAAFDAALFPGIAQLVGWWTPRRAALAVHRQVMVYDLGWIADVIPFTDRTLPAAMIIHSVSAIVRSRRRRRR